ncbi:hypothetical protein J4465_00805 [Candidatus Pacearchaeota archaeon]|nr:hypothetical protein [Candidatus Pacearchaeota archaeon]
MEDSYAKIQEYLEQSKRCLFNLKQYSAQYSLCQCVGLLHFLHRIGKIEKIVDLPSDPLQIFNFDEKEIKILQEKITGRYFPTNKKGFNTIEFNSREQAENFCIPGKYFSLPKEIFEKEFLYF